MTQFDETAEARKELQGYAAITRTLLTMAWQEGDPLSIVYANAQEESFNVRQKLVAALDNAIHTLERARRDALDFPGRRYPNELGVLQGQNSEIDRLTAQLAQALRFEKSITFQIERRDEAAAEAHSHAAEDTNLCGMCDNGTAR